MNNQEKVSEPRAVAGYGKGALIRVTTRFDDHCKNGHDTFSITASIRAIEGRHWADVAGGCLHDEIAQAFPELAHLIPYHLCSTDGPMHYVGNTVYHAGNRDHNGLLKGESRQIRNGRTGQLAWILATIDADGNEAKPEQYPKGDEQPPCPYTLVYRPWCTIGEGKERRLDYARSSALWPDATDAELMQDKATLTAALNARLPALLTDFRAAMEGHGFKWSEA